MNFPQNSIKKQGCIERIVPFMQKNLVKVLTG